MESPFQIEDRPAMQRFEAAVGSRQEAVQLVLLTSSPKNQPGIAWRALE